MKINFRGKELILMKVLLKLRDTTEMKRLLVWKGSRKEVSWSVFLSAECCGPISLSRLRGSTETVHV